MAFVEDDAQIRSGTYQRPLNYTYDFGAREFYYAFNEGGLTCSQAAREGNRMCLLSRREMSTVARQPPSFVYLDCGAWVDNADGHGTARRDFGLICGNNVYLCEFTRSPSAPQSKVEAVRNLFHGIAMSGCGVRVLNYARTGGGISAAVASDPSLYLFLADFHLPPVTWFHDNSELIGLLQTEQRDPPAWLSDTPAMRRQTDYLYRNYYSVARWSRERGRHTTNDADIFRASGDDLVRFLNALGNMNADVKRLLHFIQLGDMYELWLGRDYQFRSGHNNPGWLNDRSVNTVSNWGLEVTIRNQEVVEAFQRLNAAGLREVKYLWGNHDAYLKSTDVTGQLNLHQRDPIYTGLGGAIYAEHGHRFDRSNHDNVTAWDGPAGANAAYYVPVLRSAEPLARTLTSVGHPSTMRDCNLLGATLIYLYTMYDRGAAPFNVYVMGHSHDRQLFTFNVYVQYHLNERP